MIFSDQVNLLSKKLANLISHLTLSLFEPGIGFVNYIQPSFSANDFTFGAAFFYGWFYFHNLFSLGFWVFSRALYK